MRTPNRPSLIEPLAIHTAKRSAFTLVELLVVIGIIGVLMSILLPTMSRVRESSRRTACAAQLKDIGNQFNMYLNENKMRLPRINPDGSKFGTPQDLVPGALPVALLLKPYNGGAFKVFFCPADMIVNTAIEQDFRTDEELKGTGLTMLRKDADTWYETIGSSYEYSSTFNSRAELDDDRRLMETWQGRLSEMAKRGRKLENTWVFRDCDVFHGKKDAEKNRNYLFADFHVSADAPEGR